MASASRTYAASPEALWPHIIASLRNLGWFVVSADTATGEIVAKTRADFRSWGDKVTVHTLLLPSGRTAVAVESTPMAQLYAWGRTREDVEKVFWTLNQTVQYWSRIQPA